MCPVCTVTVVAGLGISRLLGIDDVVTSIWIGAFILSFSSLTHTWMVKKWSRLASKYSFSITAVLMYLLVLIPLSLSGTIGIPTNKLWGLDKIVLGTIIGSIALLVGVWADKKQRMWKGKQFFPYQKVVFPILSLIIASAIFLIITNI